MERSPTTPEERRKAAQSDGHEAWHPGVGAGVPLEFRSLETLVRAEASASRVADLEERADLTGLPPEELSAFLPERLALHEVIIRVTADLAVAEGDIEEQFGRNFRAMTRTLFEEAVVPALPQLRDDWQALRRTIAETARSILADAFDPPVPPAASGGWWRRLRGRPGASVVPPPDDEAIVAAQRSAGLATTDPLRRAVHHSLYRVLGSLSIRRGHLGHDIELLADLATTHAANRFGSQRLGEWLAPRLDAAIDRLGYARVPLRERPVLISLKGPSAAGKSSLRPMIKQLMRDQGIEPDGYATISPDVWRRLLLDYDALGAAYKYAGHLSSREVMVIDGKLDRYIRRKAQQEGAIPHLLVDRFRFDSFESERVGRVLHDTYARHVDTLHMYFIVTPPEETVVRGWERAIERGRYKAVEDFLGHSVEAYSGMPKLLFKWLAYEKPHYRYTFLDNRVPKGQFPRTIATGTQQEMTIYDPQALIDIGRYQRIDVNATSPAAVYPPGEDFSAAANAGFLRECLRRIPCVRFAATGSDAPYAVHRDGQLTVSEPEAFSRAIAEAGLGALFTGSGARTPMT